MTDLARTLSQLQPTLRSIKDANSDLSCAWPGVIEARRAAVLLILHDSTDGVCIVLTRRPRSLRYHADQISFPGGGWQLSDASLLHTALRETHEEIGITSQQLNAVGAIDRIHVPASNHLVTPFVAAHDGFPVIVPADAEVAEVLHVPIALLYDLDSVKTEQWDLRGQPCLVTFYAMNGVIVWGATARMLHDLARRMGAGVEGTPAPGQVRPL